LYSVDSEGAMIEALRFGNADIGIMDGGAAWVGWQQYDLGALGADQKSDGRTYYNAHAWVRADSEMASAHLDDDPYTDPFALLSGKTSCHTGWLKSAGMLLPMGFLIGHGYANVVGDPNDVETIRNTIFEYFNENASIPDAGTPYYGYEGAIKCLSDGTGDVAFAKDNTVDSYCNNEVLQENSDWCLSRDQYVALPAFGKSPSHPVMYNPELMDSNLADLITEVLVEMSADSEASSILNNVLNTPGIVATNAEDHLSSYSSLISNIPGISAYYNDKFTINGTVSITIEKVRIAYEIKADYDNIDENPQILADYLEEVLGVTVELYSVDSEGAIIEALRFGNADIAFMDGGAAWVGWKEYGLAAMAADQKSDGRTYYNAHAWVKADSEMALAHLDDDPETDPFTLLEGKTSCHTGWLKSAGMLLPMGYLIGNEYAPVIGDGDDIESLRNTIYGFFNSDASIPDSGTPYYSYSGAVKCLSDGTGDVAFAKDSTIDSYCGNEVSEDNEDWCLERDQYVALPTFGQAPSHPIMYNPESLDVQTRTAILNALMTLNYETYIENYTVMGDTYTGCYDISVHVIDEDSPKNTCGSEILENVLNTPGLVRVTSQEHMGGYSELISNIPGISSYYSDKFDIED
ncbi:PhnD/SsuA/transferrin family substrate-binding protein, partial [Euryarchaeota archaeon]|nr:PhnD/SsuA/transferrin family substrate-binding protein [Euryarchaeota archaeon]